MSKFDFPAMWTWIIQHACPVTYRTETDLFEQLFWSYLRDENAIFDAARISRIKSGRERLPRKMVALYNSRDEYVSDLKGEVETLLALDFADAPGALAELIDMVGSDETISPIQRRNLLRHSAVDGWDQPIDWVTDMICYSMLPRADAPARNG